MTRKSPLQPIHEKAEATFIPYGPPEDAAPVVETYGELEIEYAAIRKAAALIDLPHRAIVRVTGDERIDFLNRMITQELKDVHPGEARRSFWLNRKGRIDADLRVIHFDDATLFDTDTLVAQHVVDSLTEFVFAEDIELTNAGDDFHRLALHGPEAEAVLRDATGGTFAGLDVGKAERLDLAGAQAIVDRLDSTGEVGLEITVPAPSAESVWKALTEAGEKHRLRPIGWHAYNIARIEAGTPIFNIDFGASNLPGETGLIEDRVSFRKGCYLGQEVVARMQSLGHPKQRLCGIRVAGPPEGQRDTPDRQPETGAPLFASAEKMDKPVGAVTSSTRSPMLGDAIVCFAMIQWKHVEPGATLVVETSAGPQEATIGNSLVFWERSSA